MGLCGSEIYLNGMCTAVTMKLYLYLTFHVSRQSSSKYIEKSLEWRQNPPFPLNQCCKTFLMTRFHFNQLHFHIAEHDISFKPTSTLIWGERGVSTTVPRFSQYF